MQTLTPTLFRRREREHCASSGMYALRQCAAVGSDGLLEDRRDHTTLAQQLNFQLRLDRGKGGDLPDAPVRAAHADGHARSWRDVR